LFDIKSRSDKLLYLQPSQQEVKKNISFYFRLLSYIILAAAFISLRHKMIGVELALVGQVVYFSYGMSSSYTYLGGAIKKMNLVSGYRDFFYQD
jgi:hypothetical protein